MRIGVLTTSYPVSPEDPAGHFVRGFSEWLATHVAEVEVVAARAPDAATRLADGGLPALLRGRPDRALAMSARLLAAASRRASRWDAVVSHWLVPSAAVGLVLARGRRHVAVAHGSDVALLRTLPGGRALVRALARRADLVYVADALRIDGAPGRVVAMPVERWAPRPTPDDRRAARAVLGLAPPGEGPLVALFVGRLVPEKGVDLLLDALPDGVILLVAGDGPERVTLAAHPAVQRGSARLLGPTFGDPKRALFAAADLLVVPSRRDGSPTVVAEARAAGLAILGTRVGGLPAQLPADALVPATVAALRQALLERRDARPDGPPSDEGDEALGIASPTWNEVGPALWGGPRTLDFDNNIIVFRY